ncbi:alpha/beta hydrolase [Laspinema olomoucense]|uniref:Alpha/beta hydrolase n=1 Tax=Laspinema olomoucense D3b TaxID=2953688 RepID=A0ABT2NDX7_9CYAN|nr:MULTISPECIES: alpha/beta hydrolase [unclassified Laspinema]MCT7973725.1 alpha/beta hydrolase [Laspinema sp. D3d]MCT7980905.1 alpha/beta hydrolase [Laspinema sp. D3b]MCT7988090.1 alpha/beta hydrolase [Laspinema sp. D3a]MCT7995175.1 alpha/beta hydrolase [Laspinema sp. D3c]
MNITSGLDINQKFSFVVKQFHGIWKRALSLGLAMVLAVTAAVTINCDNAMAVERIILMYGDSRETISIGDLRRFVSEGAEPAEFRNRLGIIDRDIEALRFALGQEIPVSQEFLRKILNSTIGQFILTRLEPVLGIAVEENVTQVVDSFVSAAANDSFTLLELLENYPEPQLSVSGPLLEEGYNRISFLATDVLAIAQVVQTYLSDVVCEEGLFGSDFDTKPVPQLFTGSKANNLGWSK